MKYGFIGCGNMGGAIATALSKTTEKFYIADKNPNVKEFAEELGAEFTDTKSVVTGCDRIFLCVKPQMLTEVADEINSFIGNESPVIITILAGVTTEKICNAFGRELPVIRLMPNTPVGIGKGVVLYCKNRLVTDEIMQDFLNDLRFAGDFDNLPEKLFDSATALSGCGPAYVYMFIEALADGAVSCGVPRDKAMKYACQTLIGSAQMVLETGKHPGKLKDEVCSPAGSTIAGVRTLEEHGFRGAVIDCVINANKRNSELGK